MKERREKIERNIEECGSHRLSPSTETTKEGVGMALMREGREMEGDLEGGYLLLLWSMFLFFFYNLIFFIWRGWVFVLEGRTANLMGMG